jgi:nitrite reductase (NADH) large subunit
MEGQYVLLGNSAATLAAIDALRKYDRTGHIVVLNREVGPAYSRVALPYYVAGEMTLDELLIRQPRDYSKLGVELMENALVTSIDAEGSEVVLADGRKVRYQKLLIGTGSRCIVPRIRGLDHVAHHYLWTLDDAKGMKSAAEKAGSAIVIGGGFIGMLVAEALRKLNVRLTIVEMAAQLLPQLLDEEGGRRFLRAVSEQGVNVRLSSTVEAVAKRGDRVVVTLKGGESLAADMLAVAAGVQPNVATVADGPCALNQGVLVDECLRTSVPDVYAAGDVAEVKDFLSDERAIHAIWPTAVDQGLIAGANMAGRKLRYPGSLGMNVVELFDVTLAEIGRFREAPTDDVRLLSGTGADLYRKVVVDKEGTLVGAMYLGDESGVAEMGVIQGMIKRRASWREFSEYRTPRFSYATTIHGRTRSVPSVAR